MRQKTLRGCIILRRHFLIICILALCTFPACAAAAVCTLVSRHIPSNNPAWREEQICSPTYRDEIAKRLQDYHNFRTLSAAGTHGHQYLVKLFFPNGDQSLSVTVWEGGALEILEFTHPPVYQDTHHFWAFLKAEAKTRNKPLYSDTACSGLPSLEIVMDGAFSVDPHHGWDACGDDLASYQHYLDDLTVADKIKACTGGIMLINHEVHRFPEYVHVCPDNITIGDVIVKSPIVVKDEHGLYDYIKHNIPFH